MGFGVGLKNMCLLGSPDLSINGNIGYRTELCAESFGLIKKKIRLKVFTVVLNFQLQCYNTNTRTDDQACADSRYN